MSDSRNQGLYPKETIANLLNISERRIEQLSKQKIIPKAGRGVYDLGPTVQAYVRYLQGICNGSIRSDEPSDLDKRLMEAKYRADKMERDIKDTDLRKAVREIPSRFGDELSASSRIKLQNLIYDILNGSEEL